MFNSLTKYIFQIIVKAGKDVNLFNSYAMKIKTIFLCEYQVTLYKTTYKSMIHLIFIFIIACLRLVKCSLDASSSRQNRNESNYLNGDTN
jgi:hypothetical protein